MEGFIGEIRLFAGNFAPRSWALCEGQLMAISQNNALFSILGTTYGGDGRTTFGLPDLRGRAAIHSGNSSGPGLSPYALGKKGGIESVTLNSLQLPPHQHSFSGEIVAVIGAGGSPGNANSALPNGANYTAGGSLSQNMKEGTASVTLNNTGGNQSHNNEQPFTVMNYMIALFGTYPSRS